MQNRKLTLLLVTGAVALLSIVQGFLNLSKGKHTGASTAAPSLLNSQIPQALESSKNIYATRTRYREWGRNPFVLSQHVTESGVSDALFLSGIAWDNVRPQAVINGRIVGVGDTVEGSRVVEIKRDLVILDDGTSRSELPLWRKK